VSWQRVKGHDVQARAFARAAARGRLAHAYLFTGPTGIGKRLFADELAKALLCEVRTGNLEACDRCQSCILFDAGTHPDFIAVARPPDKNELPVEVMRELCRGFSLKSARGRAKIAVLNDADDLNDESANCFLKTLEEPPPLSVFFLVGTSPEAQLPTVVSRCQVVRFSPLPDALVADILREHGVEDDRLAEHAVKLARGSAGQALALADAELWAFRKKLIDGLTRSQPDTAELAKEWLAFTEEAGKEAPPQRRRTQAVLRLLIEFFDDALAVSLGAQPRLGEPEELAALGKVVKRADDEKLVKVLQRCLEADMQTERYIQLALVQEALVDALAGALAPG
jgi:DNA polymerase-3 subunit delta'